ncbi:MAG: cardiolipin synthase [Clostridia bacterium]|nr:cardiolipin synthase [Clostridia bacterium]
MKKLSTGRKKWIERTVANNRSYKLYLYNRFFIFSLLIIGQIGISIWLLYLLFYHTTLGVALQIVAGGVTLAVALYLINKTERPTMRLNWILLILVLPIVGVPSYLLYGEGRSTRYMRGKMQRAKEENRKVFEDIFGKPTPTMAQTREENVRYYLESEANYPAYGDGGISYYSNGEELFAEMLKALQSAKRFILLDYFIIAHGEMWNSILKILLEKASLGVKIRIIYDDFGCMMTLPPKYDEYLEGLRENIKCMTFNDVAPFFAIRMNHRDHRKIMVVDGKVAFTGGVNIADEYIGKKIRFGHWKDAGVKITGCAVHSFTRMFFDFWNAFRKDKEDLQEYLIPQKNGGRYEANEKKPCIQPFDDTPLDGVSVGESVYADVVNKACRYVYIFTPYLVLDDYMRSALCSAALRGVDVRIVTPAIPDKKTTFRLTRANYQPLLRAGVKIYEYTEGFIHSKCMVADDECAVVGTINLDYRSLYHHFENAVYFANCEAVLSVKKDCEETFAISKECSLKYPKRGAIGRLFDAFLRVFETLF